jgi:hypothetical protein
VIVPSWVGGLEVSQSLGSSSLGLGCLTVFVPLLPFNSAVAHSLAFCGPSGTSEHSSGDVAEFLVVKGLELTFRTSGMQLA